MTHPYEYPISAFASGDADDDPIEARVTANEDHSGLGTLPRRTRHTEGGKLAGPCRLNMLGTDLDAGDRHAFCSNHGDVRIVKAGRSRRGDQRWECAERQRARRDRNGRKVRKITYYGKTEWS